MKTRVHAFAGSLALLLVAVFWASTVVSELFLSPGAVLAVKRAILYGIPILIPVLMAAGGSGFALSTKRKGKFVETKKMRMRVMALNGLLVLAPSAAFLYGKAAAGEFDHAFFIVQSIELAAGAAQLALLGMNFRDGLRLSGRFRTRSGPAAAQYRYAGSVSVRGTTIVEEQESRETNVA